MVGLDADDTWACCVQALYRGFVQHAEVTKHFHACCSSLGRRRLRTTAQDAVCVRFTLPSSTGALPPCHFVSSFPSLNFCELILHIFWLLCARCCRLACFSCWIYVRSFVNNSPFCIDLTGYACLIAWFGLKMIGAEREIFGISQSMGNREVHSSGYDNCAIF